VKRTKSKCGMMEHKNASRLNSSRGGILSPFVLPGTVYSIRYTVQFNIRDDFCGETIKTCNANAVKDICIATGPRYNTISPVKVGKDYSRRAHFFWLFEIHSNEKLHGYGCMFHGKTRIPAVNKSYILLNLSS
jgi:hypothetical protein